VIHSPSKIVRLAVDLHEHLVQAPLSIRICADPADSFVADICGKYWAKPVPLKSNRLMADIDAAFVKQIFHAPKRKRKSNIHHHRQNDDLVARLEVPECRTFCHPQKLRAG
jgi:hypothetical protein